MKRIALIACSLTLAALTARAEIQSETIEYESNGSTLVGTLVHNSAVEGPLPAVIIFHQWSGASDYEQARARMLAAEGYAVFVADIYGKGIRPASVPDRQFMTSRFRNDRALTRTRANAALDTVRGLERVDAARIGAIGYCFGGMVALELARSGAPVAAVSSIHGSLNTPTPEDAANIKGSILIQHGAIDPYVPPEELEGLKKEMADAGVDCAVIEYENAVHSFTDWDAGDDPSKGAAYNEAADTKSWADLLDFLAARLK